ncbi:MAG: AsmA-like C-terminal region-containing protein [Bacillus subtilis]|nr:AsmA-like C-terminal region-containing protein [Bacillus subtilis]
MPNLSLQIAQGEVTGEVLYNINTQELYSRLIAQEMSANAAATVLLSTPNEVYGTLSGETQFRTSGGSRDELISNANGFATFEITDGRLTRLGSLEYLLRAVNVLQSGITGLTLNNIIDLVIPQRTGDFEVLEGTITAENGVLTTDNIASRGDNLSLFLSGNMDMISNYSDLTILGRLSRRVAGLLGPIGSLSIGTFVNFIPGIGFLPIPSERGLLELIPGLRFIPGLGLGERGRYREFVVDIEGDLYDPASVRSFRFVNQD